MAPELVVASLIWQMLLDTEQMSKSDTSLAVPVTCEENGIGAASQRHSSNPEVEEHR
jgi:hypothetical protein